MSDEFWKKIAIFMVNIGKVPFPIKDNLINFIKSKFTEEQAKFILMFKKHSISLEQIKKKTDLSEVEILKMLENLMNNGVIAGNRDEKTGAMNYTLMALFPGIIEYTFAKGEKGEQEKKLAHLVENLIGDLRDGVQENYDTLMPLIKDFPPAEQIVPVEESIHAGQETVLITEDAFKFVDQNEIIAVTHCYCKQEKELIGDPCKITDKRDICLMFGDSAKFSIEHNFAKPISKEEAKVILREAEDLGLVHKIFKSDLDYGRTIDGLCSCCKCCCGIFRYYHNGTWPYMTVTSYTAETDSDLCTGCGICVEKCPMENITLQDDVAVLDEKCIGCGLCASNCQENAIELLRTGPRSVFIPIQKL